MATTGDGGVSPEWASGHGLARGGHGDAPRARPRLVVHTGGQGGGRSLAGVEVWRRPWLGLEAVVDSVHQNGREAVRCNAGVEGNTTRALAETEEHRGDLELIHGGGRARLSWRIAKKKEKNSGVGRGG